ncbi:UDP-N-acetylglucosamine 2-epimerase (non-hydrolyzing) [Helicobacter sp. 16-1353]|uniref:non-hydrolyzing UDP-N-acetylglucosamine 2-epimerase n=1 Tax=Helicobacter sp. 16-1353 TaxID=2004996 RepID=UPI000DCF2DA7|nr:UDP-N-acetylglucosamine 2-epimerase (non-hydrolyzing) [Helicobacter sp. 16-1353]RAX52467.1 UDP-N-acetylglucosamine 2-epimerase (non-hydrolyzing) [Helicobacter sp. 16-1353]
MKKILIIFGTRPEAIKLAPLILGLKNETRFNLKVCITAQHRSMLDWVLATFGIKADYDLDIMRDSQDLFSITSSALNGLQSVVLDFKPDLIIVHGDTTTTFAGALSGFYLQIPIAHIEAGLRTFDRFSPFPEEINRQLTTKLATYHFAPTKLTAKNLLNEGVPKSHIKIVGNTVIDALKMTLEKIENSPASRAEIKAKINLPFDFEKEKFILVTCHRRESFGKEVENIAYALREIAGEFKGFNGDLSVESSLNLAESRGDLSAESSKFCGKNRIKSAQKSSLESVESRANSSKSHAKYNIHIVYPLHLNPNIQQPMRKILGNIPNIHLINPLDYESFAYLMNCSYVILTDSGGIQEEATFLHKPTLILRNKTERKEALKCHTLKLIGTKKERIIKETKRLLENKKIYQKMANPKNPLVFGDGNSVQKIIKFLKRNLSSSSQKTKK